MTDEDYILNGFNYGPKKADGQYTRYPTDGQTGKPFVRPVRTSYVHEKCGTVTTMSIALAETYARAPNFYSGTFCAGCHNHYPVGANGEFVWHGTNEKVGT